MRRTKIAGTRITDYVDAIKFCMPINTTTAHNYQRRVYELASMLYMMESMKMAKKKQKAEKVVLLIIAFTLLAAVIYGSAILIYIG